LSNFQIYLLYGVVIYAELCYNMRIKR
jgi:hypothetical protein